MGSCPEGMIPSSHGGCINSPPQYKRGGQTPNNQARKRRAPRKTTSAVNYKVGKRGGTNKRPQRRVGGKPIPKYPHGGTHTPSAPTYPPMGSNQNSMMTMEGQFINRRTGQPVPAGTPYHMHPDKGPMEGAVHNPNIPGGTAGHDFFDSLNGGGYRKGGKPKGVRKFAEGAPATPNPRLNCTSLQELINQAYCCDNSTSITGQGPNPMTNCCTQFSSYYANYFGDAINWSNTMMPDVFNEMGMDAVMSGECPNLDINGQGECSYCTNPAVRSVIQDGQVSRGLSQRVRPRTSRLGVLNRENAMEARLPIERRQRRPMSAMKRGGQVRQKPLRGRGIKRRK